MADRTAPIPAVLRFEPASQQRVWGGRALAEVFGRALPDEKVHWGESWELSARKEVDSRVVGGPLAGRTLSELWANRREEIFGEKFADHGEHFPLLIKWLDCREKLSLQVHPPVDQAAALGGEPKTESWYVAHAGPGAEMFIGFERKTSVEELRAASKSGQLAGLIQRLRPQTGELYHLPSGRVHALGGDLLIAEVQQSSDTTYRLWDWGRVGLDGKPRELHLDQGLKASQVNDVRPGPQPIPDVDCDHYHLQVRTYQEGTAVTAPAGECRLVGLVEGSLSAGAERLHPGDWAILTARGGGALVVGGEGAKVIEVEMRG